ncbi:armadillo repeat-containing protein 6 isoform X2 [Oryza brachyantha]|uniref:LRRK2 ARM repeat domain-containing protein n=1 Tax=Oryza brachyantha TaxID=4533 RepID=J3LHC0_ORYBR|nr:armadillo repeat-containing protein 6 isoform X2 [Oryza brachyantha]
MAIAISQDAFDAMVRENMEDLGMDPDEALADAVDALTLQGADLSGIIKRVPGEAAEAEVSPVMRVLDELKASAAANDSASGRSEEGIDMLASLLDELRELCSGEGLENAAVAVRNGAVEALVALCASAGVKQERLLASGFKALSSLLRDVGSTEKFRQSEGPQVVMDILKGGSRSSDILESGFRVVAAASAGNEVVKECFMDLNVDELILQAMREESNSNVQSLYDAIRVLLTPDDNRVVASQVYGYSRRFAETGIAVVLVNALREKVAPSSLPSACAALKAIAVNDEICRSISENGGIDVLLQCIDEASEQKNKVIARSCCSLLSKLAGSDANKTTIIERGGFDRFLKLTSRFSEDPPVIQEVMSMVTILALRSPENAARAMGAGYGTLAIRAMQKFPSSAQTQKQACLMIRNLVVRNPENRTILLNNGVEKLIRKAKVMHASCKDAATSALRDLGVDNYNS